MRNVAIKLFEIALHGGVDVRGEMMGALECVKDSVALIIAKQIRQFCALLLLNKRWRFGDQNLLNNRL